MSGGSSAVKGKRTRRKDCSELAMNIYAIAKSLATLLQQWTYGELARTPETFDAPQTIQCHGSHENLARVGIAELIYKCAP